ncbi:MAG: glycosyltransferase [Elusimicrobium sp.]|jgi:trehalose synthase|nr:glycosyltransferase [Elusimicrobium sp.]
MKIDNYRQFTSESEIEYIKKLGALLGGGSANIVTTARQGGGVAELLNKVIPFFADFDFSLRRINITLDRNFLEICRKFYEGLSNPAVDITQEDLQNFLRYSPSVQAQVAQPCDVLFVHDHQPIAAVEKKNYKKAIWRCHIDVSHPDALLWNFLKTFIEKYDAAAFSFPSFSGDISIPKYAIMPSIDPLSDKNKDLPDDYVDAVFKKYNISRAKPVIMQIGRFDILKDPVGVVEVFKEVKNSFDCTLVVAGGHANDDPNADKVYRETLAAAQNVPDAHIIVLEHNDLEINALQRGADIIIQKSIRESFGLAITEALWKKKPVVATETGGIPLQIIEGQTGLISVSNASCAMQIKKLLQNAPLRRSLGIAGYKHVRENFLVTRHVRDLMIMFAKVLELDF